MKGCNCKFVYHDEEFGAIVLRCGNWTKMKGEANHQKLKWCYDCLDEFMEKYLKIDLKDWNDDRFGSDMSDDYKKGFNDSLFLIRSQLKDVRCVEDAA